MTAAMELSPIELVQNPAFGSQVLWSFGRGFQAEKIGELSQFSSLFLILPLILHGPTLREIKSTNLQSGLTKLVSKLQEQRELLIAVHERAIELRNLTLESIGIGVEAKLLHIDFELALVRSNDLKMPTPPERLKYHISSAEKVGRWFGRLPLNQVYSLLQVEP
jgi:Family of unknown function (DUF6521)